MGVLSLDSYCRNKFPKAIRYYKPDQKIAQKFKVLGLDANPFVYAASAKAFEMGDYATMLSENTKTYEEKIQITFENTWIEIENVVNMVDADIIYIAFDGPAPAAKCQEQRKRRYIRPLPAENEFDTSNISTGTIFMHELCAYIQYKIQLVNGWGKKVIFSGHTVPGEGEAKCMQYMRSFPPGTPMCIYGPDGDLIMLSLASSQDFYLFKVDHSKRNSFDKQYYTMWMRPIKEALRTPKINIIDSTKSFLFLSNFLGNDFCRRIEIFDIFINGIDDLYKYYNQQNFSIIYNGRLDVKCFINLLRILSIDEAKLLAKRTKYPFPLLEKYLEGGILDFPSFRKEYYETWVHISSEDEIKEMCYNYLDTIWWTWIYYTKKCPSFSHVYKYHYPPFCCDLYKWAQSWKIPKFEETKPRTPWQQLVAILPPNRKNLLPKTYHPFFKGELFPKLSKITKNSQGKDEKYEIIWEIPLYLNPPIIDHKHKHYRNKLTDDRVFEQSDEKFKVKTKWGKCITSCKG